MPRRSKEGRQPADSDPPDIVARIPNEKEPEVFVSTYLGPKSGQSAVAA